MFQVVSKLSKIIYSLQQQQKNNFLLFIEKDFTKKKPL